MTVVCFVLILGAIMVAAFGVVRQAEHLAEKLGEPLGTLILTLTVVVIEVVLIASVMLGPAGSATIGRDSLFAVMMIIINGVLGLTILLGALKFGPQHYNLEGASVYIAMIAVLSLCTLVLPSFLSSTSDGSLVPLSPMQRSHSKPWQAPIPVIVIPPGLKAVTSIWLICVSRSRRSWASTHPSIPPLLEGWRSSSNISAREDSELSVVIRSGRPARPRKR